MSFFSPSGEMSRSDRGVNLEYTNC